MSTPVRPLAFRVVLATASRWRAQLLEDTGVEVTCVPAPIDEQAITAADPVALALKRAVAKAEAVAALHPDALVIGADQVAHLDGVAFGKPQDPADHRARLRSLRGRVHTLTTGVSFRGGPVRALGTQRRPKSLEVQDLEPGWPLTAPFQVEGGGHGVFAGPSHSAGRNGAKRPPIRERGSPSARVGGPVRARELDFVEHTGVRFHADLTDAEIDAYVESRDGSECAGGYRAEGPGAWLIAGIDGDWSNMIGLPVFGVLGRVRGLLASR